MAIIIRKYEVQYYYSKKKKEEEQEREGLCCATLVSSTSTLMSHTESLHAIDSQLQLFVAISNVD